MSTQYYIEDVALPEAQDFNALKKVALTYLQEHCGNQWTNFNPSDPGVTILDQLCYALTELGYCTDFPMEDLLTAENEELVIKDQFYRPEKILTTAPVTVNDFKRCVLENEMGVSNLIISAIYSEDVAVSGVYKVWLSVDEDYKQSSEDICESVGLYLNQQRNIGEYFLKPQVFKSKEYHVFGELNLRSLKNLKESLQKVQAKVNDFIFPPVNPKGYQQLKDEGRDINNIINGPDLKSGWIEESELVPKKDKVAVAELIPVLLKDKLITSISGVYFQEKKNTSEETISTIQKIATSDESELIAFNLVEDVLQGRLKVKVDGHLYATEEEKKSINNLLTASQVKQQKSSGIVEYALHSRPSVPQGKFRDVESYHSIQHDFPEIYAVGSHAINNNTSDYQVALSRQLKGYLSLYDQVMANQFSQLANLDKLLSFKNALTADYADEQRFHASKSDSEKEHPIYPVPFKRFAPSYFCQSIYHAPNIKDLLLGYEQTVIDKEQMPEREREHKKWKTYQDNPYNTYIYGLMQSMESDSVAFTRRNTILNHLLARHGQSPELIDAIIENAVYYGDREADQIIFKSLYLQNFAILNYHAQSAYSAMGAKPIALTFPFVNENEVNALKEGVEKDFVFSARKVDHLEKVTEDQLTSFYGVALKFNLLLGIRSIYKAYILELADQVFGQFTFSDRLSTLRAKEENELVSEDYLMSMAYWFMQQRGAIFIESALLLQSATCKLTIARTSAKNNLVIYYTINESISYDELQLLKKTITKQKNSLTEGTISCENKSYTLTKIKSESIELVSHPASEELHFSYTANWGSVQLKQGDQPIKSSLLTLVPDFIQEFSSPGFQKRMELLMNSSLSLQLSCQMAFVPAKALGTLVMKYINWYNRLIYNKDAKDFSITEWKQQKDTACAELMNSLIQLTHYITLK